MLTLFKIVLISTLFISLPFGSHMKQNLGKNTTESISEGLKMMENKSVSLEKEENINLRNVNRNTSDPKAHGSLLLNISTIHETMNSTRNLSTDNFSRDPIPTSIFSTSLPLIQGFVSKLPLNSSIADRNLLPVSLHPNSTHDVSSENSTWSLDDDTMETPDNSTIVTIHPAPPTTKSVTPSIMKPTAWLTTNSNDFTGFTSYQERTTLQPTLKFTNNSKLSPNTSDSQKENRNTGIVFGAILGAILGASLLSLVGYLLCGKTKTDSFSHRRLYEDRNEPVLRLDNTPDPYDMNFGNSSYFNPTVSDSSMAENQENAQDGIPMDNIPALRTSV